MSLCAKPLDVLQVLLLLSLLLTTLTHCASQESNFITGERYIELRCTCLKTTSRIKPSLINSLKIIKAGAYCDKVELIATLKDGTKVCLDPEAPMIKKIVQKLMENQ